MLHRVVCTRIYHNFFLLAKNLLVKNLLAQNLLVQNFRPKQQIKRRQSCQKKYGLGSKQGFDRKQGFGRKRGFSMLEILCVLLILTLLTGISWQQPFRAFLEESAYERVKLAQKDLANGLLKARQYAVQTKRAILLCGGIKSVSLANQSSPACSGLWSEGWLIQDQKTVKATRALSPHVSVSWSGFPANKKYIRFHANGHTDYQNGTFILRSENWRSRITINQSGRFYLGKIERVSQPSFSSLSNFSFDSSSSSLFCSSCDPLFDSLFGFLFDSLFDSLFGFLFEKAAVIEGARGC